VENAFIHLARPSLEGNAFDGIIIIHLLGLAPAGYMTTPDDGPEGRLRVGASQGDGCRAVPLNLLILGVARKPSGKKITTQVLEGGPTGSTPISVCPEPATPRKPPALLPSS
jgi:hypothetical protein